MTSQCVGYLVDKEVESLHQQLATCNAAYKAHHGFDWNMLEACHESQREYMKLLAESQAREANLRSDMLGLGLRANPHMTKHEIVDEIKRMYPSDSTALDSAIRQAKREALLDVIVEWEKPYTLTDGTSFIGRLRRMADNV